MMLTLDPTAADLRSVVDQVWSTFLSADDLDATPAGATVGGWSGAVCVTGAWTAQITLSLSEQAAVRVAAQMLDLPQDHCTREDVGDSLGELVNMVGGSVKSLMTGPSELSLPLVAHGDIPARTLLSEVARLDLAWAGEPVSVVVHVLAVPSA